MKKSTSRRRFDNSSGALQGKPSLGPLPEVSLKILPGVPAGIPSVIPPVIHHGILLEILPVISFGVPVVVPPEVTLRELF